MGQSAFIFTILFMLLGPLKVIGPFAVATHGADVAYKRRTAALAALYASAICAFLALSGEALIAKYRISPAALNIGAGLVLLIAALRNMFLRPDATASEAGPQRKPAQVALSPLAAPVIVPPAGVAAILIVSSKAAGMPGIAPIVAMGIAVMMVLDFLVMFFNDALVRQTWLMLILQLLGSALVFLQAALAIDSILEGLRLVSMSGH